MILHTLRPTCCSSIKNCAPRSSSVTNCSSWMVIDPIPARTRFFAISFARAFMPIRRMLAVRSLDHGQSSKYNGRSNMDDHFS